MLSNWSYMKRVMILVLPMDWSPKNTSLYFAKADTGAIFFVPISNLYHCYSTTTPRFFEFRASKSGISNRIAALSWAEFLYRKVRVCCFAHEMGMVSSLGCEFAIVTMLSLFRTFLFGFYNFIWGIPTFGNNDFVWVQLNARFDQCVNLVIIWFDFTNLVLETCWKKLVGFVIL